LNLDLGNAIKGKSNLNKSTIGAEISLGESGKMVFTKDQRQALRALLLCQRYFLSNLGSPNLQLENNWNRTSINYWKFKNKGSIDEGIQIYRSTSSNPDRLATVARDARIAPDLNGGSLLKISRHESLNNFGNGICYLAIMIWLLKSGLVSLPWYLSVKPASTIDELKNIFSTPIILWDNNQVFTQNTQLASVPPPGYIVYINNEREMRNGHWMVSVGSGYAVGCNNSAIAGAIGIYDNHVSIKDEFLLGFNNQALEGIHARGVAYMFNPAGIPNRNMF
jgi:hypothetical protein